jgi:hypothetical protein
MLKEYAESARVLESSMRNVSNYIRKYFARRSQLNDSLDSMKPDVLEDLGKCLVSACDNLANPRETERDKLVFGKFTFNVMNLAEGYEYAKALDEAAKSFWFTNLEARKSPKDSLYDFCRNGVLSYYDLGMGIGESVAKLERLKISPSAKIAETGSRILFRHLLFKADLS